MCFPSFRESKPAAKVVNTWERLPFKARERATAEKHLAWTLSWRDGWRTGVGRGTQTSEGVQASRNLIAVAAFLSFPTFNHLPRSLFPFKFGIPNAHAWLSGRHSCRNGKPRHTRNFRRKQNERFKEIGCGHGPDVGPMRYPCHGADRQ